jgi:aminoglycoside 3-N-acetyltransferase
MGSLIEYIRQQPGVRRSLDPLLSMIVVGKQDKLFDGDLGHHSLGREGGFGRLHETSGVKFLCFGADFGTCFTYVHFVEKLLDVPYRFDMLFDGTITDWNGNTVNDVHYMHTACGGILPADFPYFEEYVISGGWMKRAKLGSGKVCCISEPDVYREIVNKIEQDINYFLEKPFKQTDLTQIYTKSTRGERITHC